MDNSDLRLDCMEEEQQIAAWHLNEQDNTNNTSMIKICIREQFGEFYQECHMCTCAHFKEKEVNTCFIKLMDNKQKWMLLKGD